MAAGSVQKSQPVAPPTVRPAIGITEAEYVHGCLVCGSSQTEAYCRVPSLFSPGEFVVYERCRTCGTVFRNPRIPAGDRLARYQEKIEPEEAKRLCDKNQLHYAVMMRSIRKHLPTGRTLRLLDFGCGAGGFLVEAKAAGFDAVGLEVCRDLARHVQRTYGIPTLDYVVDDPRFRDERFDVILSSQVFEHLTDPRGTLDELTRHLVPGGVLLIEVPNMRDIRERLRRGSTMDDSHLFYFTASSLSRMLIGAGYRVLQVQEGVRPWGVLRERSRRIPLGMLEGMERLLSVAQLKTGLAITARLG